MSSHSTVYFRWTQSPVGESQEMTAKLSKLTAFCSCSIWNIITRNWKSFAENWMPIYLWGKSKWNLEMHGVVTAKPATTTDHRVCTGLPLVVQHLIAGKGQTIYRYMLSVIKWPINTVREFTVFSWSWSATLWDQTKHGYYHTLPTCLLS
jgi:hypothetical protein